MATRHLGVALIACGCAVLVPLAPRADAASSYVVRQGDSLWTIAARLHVGLERLLSVNHLTDASTIHPGERLVVPDAAAAPAPSGAPRATTYVVRAGDTLSAIAARMGVGVQPLAAANHLSLASTLHPGQTLVAPGAEASSASAPGPARIAAGPTRAIGSPVSDAPAHPAAAAGPTSVTATAPSQVARAQTASRAALAPVRTSLPSRGAAFTSAVVRTALRFLGRPYQWAGIGNRGFDCSGLVFRVFASMGLSVPHSSFDQFREGIAVPRWALSPGDLVFFHTYGYGASHVGIYVGGDRFVHASSDRGVVISSLSEPYYYYRYLGARRI